MGIGQAPISNILEEMEQEYLPQLHKRGRWLSHSNNIKIGTLEILKDNNQPPLKWKLVRVTKIHPGKDGITRVVTVLIHMARSSNVQ